MRYVLDFKLLTIKHSTLKTEKWEIKKHLVHCSNLFTGYFDISLVEEISLENSFLLKI